MFKHLTAWGLAAVCLPGAFAATPIQTNGAPVQGSLTASDTEALPAADERGGPGYYRDVYTFQAQQGETVDIRLQADYDGYLLLFGPSGALVATNDDATSVRDSRIASQLTEAGEYTVGVTSFGSGTQGTYSVSVQSLGVGAPLPSDYSATPSFPGLPDLSGFPGMEGLPPGFDPSMFGMPRNLPPIEGTTIQGELAATDTAPLPSGLDRSAPGYYRDIYPGPGNANDMMSLEVSGEFDTYLYLLGPDGSVVAENDDSQSTRHSRIDDAVLPTTGTYQVVVTSFSTNTTGPYTLVIGNPRPAPPRSPDSPIALGETVQGSLDATDNAEPLNQDDHGSLQYYRDGYTFTGTPNSSVQIDLTSSFDGYLILVGPDGQEVARNDDFSSTSQSRIQATLTAPGTYRVIVTSYMEGLTGTYTLALQSYVAPPPTPDTPISIGQTLQGSLAAGDNAPLPSDQSRSGTDYFRDGYSFTGTAGSAVTINAVYMGFDGYLFLVDPNGSLLDANDDGTSTGDSQIAMNLPSAGTYRIVVSSYSQGRGGAYSLTLTQGIVGGIMPGNTGVVPPPPTGIAPPSNWGSPAPGSAVPPVPPVSPKSL